VGVNLVWQVLEHQVLPHGLFTVLVFEYGAVVHEADHVDKGCPADFVAVVNQSQQNILMAVGVVGQRISVNHFELNHQESD
jgi:hypothetical protein